MKRARTGCGVALLNGLIHLVGGRSIYGDDKRIVDIYDPESNSCFEVSFNHSKPC